jgi:hypothetical protein
MKLAIFCVFVFCAMVLTFVACSASQQAEEKRLLDRALSVDRAQCSAIAAPSSSASAAPK